jgi:hypothetical protein
MRDTSVGRTLRSIRALVFGSLLLMSTGKGLYAQSEQSSAGLQGTWWVQVTQYDCANPDVTRPPFVSLLAFARGGTMSETTANPAFQPGQRTSGYGTWKQLPDGSYVSIDLAFILFTAGPFSQGTQRINHSITVAGDVDHFNDIATVQFFDTHGTLLISGCARAVGTRLR